MAGRNFLFVPGPTNTPDRDPPRHAPGHGGPSLVRLPVAGRPRPGRSEEDLQDHLGPGVHFPGQWHRRVGGLALQHPLARRQGARRALRHVQPPLDRHGAAAGPPGGGAGRRVGRGRADRALPGGARGRQEPPDQGGALHPQRDRHRRHQRRGRRAQGAERHAAPGAPDGRRCELDRQHRFPDGRVGRGPRRHRLPEGPHAAGRPRHRVRQPEGARPVRPGQAAPRLLRLRRHAEGQRHRLLPLHAVAPDAVRAARVDRHAAGGGAGERLRPAPPAGRRAPAGRSRRGAWSSAPGRPNGTPTPSARSWSRRASTARR